MPSWLPRRLLGGCFLGRRWHGDGEAGLQRLFDAHCHLQLRSALGDAVPKAQRCGVAGAAVCGCHATDWEKVEMLYQQLGETQFPDFVVPSFGIHPWWASTSPAEPQLTTLRQCLERMPEAAVGHWATLGAR
eukprot:Skav224055  [mRNA]  locus=scaffold534:363001:364441:- [translate_table: standard]